MYITYLICCRITEKAAVLLGDYVFLSACLLILLG
jgi:hypothetical protein